MSDQVQNASRPSRARWAAFLGVISLVLIMTATITTRAQAATITGAITGVTVTSPTQFGGGATITEQWCVPNGSQPGDTFTQTLPTQLGGYPNSFVLVDPAGGAVANATISSTIPAVVTFTLTAYVATHQHVCGTAFFTAYSATSANDGTTQTLIFDNGGTTESVPVTFPAAPTTVNTAGQKTGAFTTSGDQCRTVQTDCLAWSIESSDGPLDSGSMLDDAPANESFDCATVTTLLGTDTGGGFTNGVAFSTGVTVTCSPSQLKVAFGALTTHQALLVTFRASLTTGANAGGIDYENTADITGVLNGVQSTTPAHAFIDSSTAGGNGSGTQTPAIAITKWSTADGATNGAFDTAPGKAIAANTPTPITMTITNTGTEPLVNVTVSDSTSAGPALTGLSCDFSALGGAATGVSWAGPFAAGASFNCTGTVPAMGYGVQESDTASVNANGQTDNTPVSSTNPWNGATPAPTPAISIVKGDSNGNAADTAAAAVTLPNGQASLVYTVTNTGTQALTGISVSDQMVTNGTVTGLTCDFSALGGPSTGTTWSGPFAPGAHFGCTAGLSISAGADHEDIGTVSGVGGGTTVTASNPYFANTPATSPGGGGATSTPATASAIPPLVTAPASSSLAFTGVDTAGLVGLGGGLLIAGLMLMLASRRREGGRGH